MPRNRPFKTLTIRIPEEVHNLIGQACDRNDILQSEFIRESLLKNLDQYGFRYQGRIIRWEYVRRD
jgi:predicted HicB family RNase H-like nuclease